MRKFHCYIYGRHFRLLTDHKPLLSIFGSKVGVAAYSANRLRWELVLLAYDFVIEYRRSTHFGQAGALSRLIASKNLPEDEDIVIAKIEQDVRAVQGDVIRHFPVTKEDIRRMTEEDPELELVVEAVNTRRWPKFLAGSTLHAFHSRSADLSVYEGALSMGTRAVVPSCETELWRCCMRDTQEPPEWRCWLGGTFIGKELTVRFELWDTVHSHGVPRLLSE